MNPIELSDHDAHLRAVHSLVACLAKWNEGYSRLVDDAIDAEMTTHFGVDLVGPAFDDTSFAHVAQNLAFITTIAAFVESFFKECLPAMKRHFKGSYVEGHTRVQKYGETNPSFWDPMKPTTKGDKIVTRISDILEGSGLIQLMIPDFTRVLDVIFKYRNQMIHNGFEWSLPERRKFARIIQEEGWSGWFAISTVDDEPWYFTLTDAFHQACLDLCDRSVLAFAGLLREDWDRYRNRYES